jgi:xanthine dehydrogenase accessory factor
MDDRLPLLRTAREWLEQGRAPWLLHVARTWGSSPRPVGSLMLLDGSGRHAGSVSGGCVEGDLFQRLADGTLDPHRPRLIEYGGDSNPHIRLPCRTSLQLVVEPLSDASRLREAIEAIEQRRPVYRRLDLASGRVDYREAEEHGQVDFDGETLCEGFGPPWRALLIGANDLASHVARQCLVLGYEVYVCDPREEYRRQWDEAGTTLIDGMPDEAVDRWLVDSHCALLALTHDPRLDDMALLQALPGPAFYVGALGSRRSAERRRETLARMGLDTEQIARLDAPIGLNIGSRRPAEIAVAIAARLIQVRNAGQAQPARLQAIPS